MRKKYTNEFLIETLKEYAKLKGRTPTYQEFEKDSSVPSATVYIKRFSSWNKALEKAGLKVNAIRKHNKEDIVKDALNFYRTHGRSPYYYELNYSMTIIRDYWDGWNDFLNDIGLPQNLNYSLVTSKDDLKFFLQNLYKNLGRIPNSVDAEKEGVGRHLFLTKFGSFKNALIESGIVKEDYFISIEEKITPSLEAIKEFYHANERPPTVMEYEKLAKQLNIHHRKALEQALEKRFTEICMETLGVANQFKRSREQLLDDLKKLKDHLGRTPMANELVKFGLAEKKQYYRTFRMPYNDLIEKVLGWELSTPKLHNKNKNELLEDYHKLYKILGRLPFYNDIDNQNWMASSATYKKHFNNLKTVWDILEINYDRESLSNNFGLGLICFDKNGDICRSVPEMIISNILIDLELKFIKEHPYNKCIPNFKKKYKFDWFLIEFQIPIEFFGLFSEQSLDENNFIGRYSRNVLKKIDVCEKHKLKLIDLYSEDMENIEEILLKRLMRFGVSFGK
jgi:hypothetical protein